MRLFLNVVVAIVFLTEPWPSQAAYENNTVVKLFTRLNETHPIYLHENISMSELEGFCTGENCTNFIVIHGYRVYITLLNMLDF